MLATLLLAAAQVTAPPACPPLPAELAGWPRTTPLTAGAGAADAPALMTGSGVQATLRPIASVVLAPAPRRAVRPGSSGGVFAVTLPGAGRYRVALGGPAWVDLVRDGRTVASAAHGQACAGVRKMVDFDLRPGRYLLQVADSPSPTLQLMVARLR